MNVGKDEERGEHIRWEFAKQTAHARFTRSRPHECNAPNTVNRKVAPHARHEKWRSSRVLQKDLTRLVKTI